MVIAREAIERFLEYTPPPIPTFKGSSLERLTDYIAKWNGGKPYFAIGPEPRKYQFEGIAFALWIKRGLLYYDMRMGKSKCAIDWVRTLKYAGKLEGGKILIIAHAPLGVDVWETQSKIHSDLNIKTLKSGGNALDRFADLLEGNSDGIVSSWATLQSLLTVKRRNRKGAPKLYPDLDVIKQIAPYFKAVIIDEIHLAGNHLSLRFQIAAPLTEHTEYALGLTGTPIGRDPFKIWASTFLIDRGATLGTSYYFFAEVFGRKRKSPFVPTGFEVVFDKDKLPLLQERMRSISLSYRLSEVQEVNVIRNVIDLHMTGDQLTAYNEVIDGAIKARREDQEVIKNAFIRLRQISSGFVSFSDDEGEQRLVTLSNNAKLEWLAEFIAEYDGTTPCVIFHEFTRSGQIICDFLTKHKLKHAWLYGKTKDRAGTLRKFTEGKLNFLVANTVTGGTAIDIPRADYMLFYESTTNPITRQQAEARPLARGARVLLMDDVVCSPVERKILKYIGEGKDMLSAIVRDRNTLFERQ